MMKLLRLLYLLILNRPALLMHLSMPRVPNVTLNLLCVMRMILVIINSMNNRNQRKAIRLLSLNCNSLFKLSKPNSRKHLIWYIHLKQPTFVTLQEVDNSQNPLDHFSILHKQFCSFQSFWNQYCGIVSLDNQFHLEQIPLPEDSRCILTRVSRVDQEVSLFFILVLYAPASSSRERISFFNSLLDFAQLSPYSDQSCIERLIIAGDFNYDASNIGLCSSSSRNGLRQWNHFLRCHFRNVKSDLRQINTPTFVEVTQHHRPLIIFSYHHFSHRLLRQQTSNI